MKIIKVNESIANLDRVEDVQPVEDIVMADARQFSDKISQKSVLERVEEIIGKEAFTGAKEQPTPKKVEVPKPLLLDESLFEDYEGDEELLDSDEEEEVLEEDIFNEMANDGSVGATTKKRIRGTAFAWRIVALGLYYACKDPSGPQLTQIPSSNSHQALFLEPWGLVNFWHELFEHFGILTSQFNFNTYAELGLWEVVPSPFRKYQTMYEPNTRRVYSGGKPATGLIPGPTLDAFMSGKFHATWAKTGNQNLGLRNSIDFITNPDTEIDANTKLTANDVRQIAFDIIANNPKSFEDCKGNNSFSFSASSSAAKSANNQFNPNTQSSGAQATNSQSGNALDKTPDLSATSTSSLADLNLDDEDDVAANESLCKESSCNNVVADIKMPKLKKPSLSMQIDKKNDSEKVEAMKKAFRKEKRLDECCDITDDMYDYKTVQKICCLNSWAPEQFKYYVFDRIDL